MKCRCGHKCFDNSDGTYSHSQGYYGKHPKWCECPSAEPMPISMKCLINTIGDM